jgi:hypothetical protein
MAPPSDKSPVGDDKLLLEIDGPDVHPYKVDVRAALALAHRYVDLVVALADEDAAELQFTGLQVLDKCVAFELASNEPDLARREAKRANRCVAGAESVPPGALTATRELRTALRRLPPTHVVHLKVGTFREEVKLAAASPILSAEAQVSLRAVPLRAGGTTPAVRFESKSEERPFTLEVSKELARMVGRFLYSEIDIVALVKRDEEGLIESGRLVSFEPVTDDDATAAWRDWYAHNASEWDTVKDVEGELGRDRN